MGVSFTLKMDDVSRLVDELGRADEIVIEGWGKDAQTLLETEIANVTKRTQERAFDTGALASSVTGQAYQAAKNGTLISVWFNSAQQYAQWNRYYAPYQEGPPIGKATYTNEPRHMLFDSQTEDAGQIADWAVKAGQAAADEIGL